YLAERLLAGLESQARLGRVLEALLFLAVLYERMGDGGSLNRVFERALNFARTEGYQRTLIDLGADFALIARGYSGPHLDYLKQLMDALAASIPAPEVYLGNAENLRNAGVLSQRELEVLRLVADGRTNQEIADQLFISLNTVKTHVRHIFQCLDARNRAEAIARGREHSLI
ncbi:MAG TPA: response regulator transcription factor, partial [Anaerolineales bacterium]|nr:response regulator transcription factor [Anaerolineales bacterium]